jgi:hypothetical protein
LIVTPAAGPAIVSSPDVSLSSSGLPRDHGSCRSYSLDPNRPKRSSFDGWAVPIADICAGRICRIAGADERTSCRWSVCLPIKRKHFCDSYFASLDVVIRNGKAIGIGPTNLGSAHKAAFGG